MRYVGIASKMAIIIGLGAYAGVWLDEYQQNETPVWTIVLCLAGVGLSLYEVIKDVSK